VTANWLAEGLILAEDRNAPAGAKIRLAAARCSACERCSFPAASSCTWCGATCSHPEQLSDGTAVAATAVLHRTPGAVVDVPFVVALVRFGSARLDVLGRVLGTADPAAVGPGMPLRVVAESLPDGRMHYAFACHGDKPSPGPPPESRT
jgi:uncharacterized OB-fold protein